MIKLQEAEMLALQAFEFLGNSPEQLERLMSVTGHDPASLSQALQSPDGLAGVLDYMCQDESLLLAFCETANLPPNLPMRALDTLQRPASTGAL